MWLSKLLIPSGFEESIKYKKLTITQRSGFNQVLTVVSHCGGHLNVKKKFMLLSQMIGQVFYFLLNAPREMLKKRKWNIFGGKKILIGGRMAT